MNTPVSPPKYTYVSPYDRRAYAYIDRGYSVIPIAPGTKRPGQWSKSRGWRGMSDWERFSERQPTELELEVWYTWPDAGIGLLTGKLSGVIGLDRDYDTNGTDALDRLIPYTPVKKKGAKGYTAFFRYSGEPSCSFDINGARVLDVLSDGRQTLMPGTIHPDGHTYIYLTEDCLEDYNPQDLPVLPPDFLERVAKTIAPYQTGKDREYQKQQNKKKKDNDANIDTSLSIHAEYFKELNRVALEQLENWVTKIIPLTQPERDGFRTVATWRGCVNPNVGIHPTGIFDFGGNYGMTPIDLVMRSNGITFQKAAEALRGCLTMMDEAPLTMTVGGAKSIPATSVKPVDVAAPPVVVPPTFPWLRTVVAPQSAPTPVMLPPQTSIDPAPALPGFMASPPGALGDIARWITATAPKAQPELSLAAAISLCSVIMARSYRSQFGNYTSLYMIMVAKSTEGKEHPQGCVSKILAEAGLPHLIGGSGYTSAGGVFSALLEAPAHLATIDEMGKLLKMSRAAGQSHSEAALDKLVEAFGRLDGIMRPPTYSKMTLGPSAQSNVDKVVHNPAISILGATTPGTFYGALTTDLVQDGFLGRCIVVESVQPRQLTRFVDRTNPPQPILDWCQRVHVSHVVEGNLAQANFSPADMPATVIPLPFDDSCLPLFEALERDLNDEKDASEGEGLDVILGRTLEKAMRLAMIVAKATDTRAKCVTSKHLEWAIQYVRHYDLALIRAVRRERVQNQTDGDIKKAIKIIKSAAKYSGDKRYGQICAAGGMPHSVLLRLMHMTGRALTELMDTATEANLVRRCLGSELDMGYAGNVYFPIDE